MIEIRKGTIFRNTKRVGYVDGNTGWLYEDLSGRDKAAIEAAHPEVIQYILAGTVKVLKRHEATDQGNNNLRQVSQAAVTERV